MLRLSKIAGLLTLLDGSLVRIQLSLYHGGFWLVQQHREHNATGLCFASATEKSPTYYGPEEPRERTSLFSKLQTILCSSIQSGCPYAALLAMDARQACLRPSENCTFLCWLHGRLCARFKYSQTAKQNQSSRNHADGTELCYIFVSLLSLELVISHVQPLGLLRQGLVKLLL